MDGQGGLSKANGIQLNTLASSNIDECLDVKNMHIKHDNDDAFDDLLDSWHNFDSLLMRSHLMSRVPEICESTGRKLRQLLPAKVLFRSIG